MKITGELLKSERIKLKLSQQDIAFALKLSPRIINAIEEGDTESLPAKTFLRGFVKSYAEMLKLDSTMVLSQFQEEMGTTRPLSKVVASPSENAKAKTTYNFEENAPKEDLASVTPNLKMNLNKNTLKLVAVITFAVIVIGGINQIINKYQKEVSTSPEVPKLTVENLTQEANSNKDLVETPPVETAASATTAATAPLDSISSQTGAVSAAIPVSESTTQKPSEQPVATQETKQPETLATAKSVELVIEATKDTVISYSVGNENNYKTLELKKNTFQIIKSKSGLYLKVDEGNSISITVNGINKGLASSSAKPIKLSY
jgi:cytoskeleton protein RodZ